MAITKNSSQGNFQIVDGAGYRSGSKQSPLYVSIGTTLGNDMDATITSIVPGTSLTQVSLVKSVTAVDAVTVLNGIAPGTTVNLGANSSIALTNVEAASDAAAPTNSVQIGGLYETSITEVDNDDIGALAIDSFKRLQVAGYDSAQGLVATQDSTTVSGVPFKPGAWTQTTAVGVSAARNVEGYKNVSFTVTVAAIGDSVSIRWEGSIDGGTKWFNLNENQGPTGVTLITANGEYYANASNRSLTHVRFNHVAESAAAVTCDANMMASN